MQYLLGAIGAIVWVYALHVLARAELRFWRFFVGCMGLFVLLMIFVRPWALQPLASTVAALAGVVGGITDTFQAYFHYGVLFVDSPSGPITMQVDFECSGIIEIMVYISLLTFFQVYTRNERILVGILGVLFIILSNVLRIVVICEVIHFGGADAYFIAHTLVGRIVFYALTIVLYFFVFTRPQVVRMKVGRFTYGMGGESSR